MIPARVASAALCFFFVTPLCGCDQTSPAAPSQTPPEDLAARVKALEDLVPSQSHMMADVGEHFTNLWFAGRAENWPLADFYLAETKSHLRWAVRRIPIRKDNQGRDVNLGNILEAFENSQLTQLKGTIDGKDKAALREGLQGKPHHVLLVPQSGRQALPEASDAHRARVAHHQFRPQGGLAALS